MSHTDDLLREAVALLRKVRNDIGMLPQSYGYDITTLPPIDAFLAKFAVATGEVPEGFTLVENKALSTARMALAHATTTHGELYLHAYESLLAASKGEKP
jgi:hypothetical protein